MLNCVCVVTVFQCLTVVIYACVHMHNRAGYVCVETQNGCGRRNLIVLLQPLHKYIFVYKNVLYKCEHI